MVDISVGVMILSAEVRESIKQMDRLFGVAFAASVPISSGLKKLAIQLRILHPAGDVARMRGSGSYDKTTDTFFASAPIDYVAWAAGDWQSRVRAYADATSLAIKAIYKTRISELDRRALLSHIESIVDELSSTPPSDIAEILPVHLVYEAGDSSPPRVIYDWSATGAPPTGRVVVVPPSQAASYAGVACSKTDRSPTMFKLYRRVGKDLEYYEAWPTDEGIIEHRGRCGERGRALRHATRDVAEQHRILTKLRDAAKSDGFRNIPQSRLATLIVECQITGSGSTDDIDRRHALEEFLDEQLGWLGLGHCDGGASGAGSMEVFCFVVDHAIAQEALAPILSTPSFSDFKFRPQKG
jgi:hypothetical protein